MSRFIPDRLYHLADARNWDSIKRRGLLCTNDLLTLSDCPEDVVLAVQAHRPTGLQLPSGAFIRDQRPMAPIQLAKGLDPGLEPADWYALINGCVFFWLDEERLRRHWAAQRGQEQILLSFDGPKLAKAYAQSAAVTPFNLGAAFRKPALRGLRSFVPLEHWIADGWAYEAAQGRKPRSASHKPAEFVIRGSIPDAMDYLLPE